MIELTGVRKWYATRQGRHVVLDAIDLSVNHGEKLGILGLNGTVKSTLIPILSGIEQPNAGQVRRDMSISWPLAFSGGFQGSLTGLDNLKFISRVYGADHRDKADFVQSFAALGKYFREPVKSYSSGMRARLAFAISLSIEFDCYLIDETLSVGDARFTDRCREELFEKRKDRAKVMVSHDVAVLRNHCDRAFILNNGSLQSYDNIEDAIKVYKNL